VAVKTEGVPIGCRSDKPETATSTSIYALPPRQITAQGQGGPSNDTHHCRMIREPHTFNRLPTFSTLQCMCAVISAKAELSILRRMTDRTPFQRHQPPLSLSSRWCRPTDQAARKVEVSATRSRIIYRLNRGIARTVGDPNQFHRSSGIRRDWRLRWRRRGLRLRQQSAPLIPHFRHVGAAAGQVNTVFHHQIQDRTLSGLEIGHPELCSCLFSSGHTLQCWRWLGQPSPIDSTKRHRSYSESIIFCE
jgi:hypothetical protein